MMFLFLLACQDDSVYNSQFDGPSDVAVLNPGEHLDDPIGFVLNVRSSKIIPVNLKTETPFSDQVSAPFLRPRGIATGDLRQLIDLETFVTDELGVVLFSLDQYTQNLIEIPYYRTLNPYPVLSAPTYSTLKTEGGESTEWSLLELELDLSEVTTETWHLFYDKVEEGWWVEGSRSGRQPNLLYENELWSATRGGLSFKLTPPSSYFEEDKKDLYFDTSSGILEYPLNGMPVGMLSFPDEQKLLIAVTDSESERSKLLLFDQVTHQFEAQWPPENTEGIEIEEMSWADDRLFLSSSNTPYLHQLMPQTVDESSSSAQFLEALINNQLQLSTFIAPAAGSHMAYVDGSIHDALISSGNNTENDEDQNSQLLNTKNYRHLFLAEAKGNQVYIWDITEERWLHINPSSAESKGINLSSLISGLTPIPSIFLQNRSSWQGRKKDHAVVATTFAGDILLIEGSTGCLATTQTGPTLADLSSYSESSVVFTDVGPASNPELLTNGLGEQVTLNPCGGIVRNEQWTLTYDGFNGDWIVEGELSGEQEHRAVSNQRYQTDLAQLSFTLIHGTQPPTDGDSFTFFTNANTLSMNTLLNSTGRQEPLQFPRTPHFFTYQLGAEDGGWEPITQEPAVVVPITNSDILIRLDLESWMVSAVWN
ncbi:MAG: hypothetical protein CMK59_10425 [Proteobacteria bacterium]|nr:hypothetical protein [Pseudomonadota bacterium]